MTENRLPLTIVHDRDAVPPPPVSRDVSVTTFPYMPLDVHRLLSSTTWRKAAKHGKLGHILMTLWCEAFRATPGGSVPNDDEVLATLALCTPEEWKEYKDRALSGFTLCTDNRYYHTVVNEKVQACLTLKIASKERTEAARAERKRLKELKEKKRRDRRT